MGSAGMVLMPGGAHAQRCSCPAVLSAQHLSTPITSVLEASSLPRPETMLSGVYGFVMTNCSVGFNCFIIVIWPVPGHGTFTLELHSEIQDPLWEHIGALGDLSSLAA